MVTKPEKILTEMWRCGPAAREVSRGAERKPKLYVKSKQLTECCQINFCAKWGSGKMWLCVSTTTLLPFSKISHTQEVLWWASVEGGCISNLGTERGCREGEVKAKNDKKWPHKKKPVVLGWGVDTKFSTID